MWSTLVDEVIREKKLWGHVTGTVIRPPPACVVAIAVAAAVEGDGSETG